MNQQTYIVSGMTCAACFRHVEKVLASTPGISAVSVNLATSRVTVEGTASFEEMALQVEDAGYGLGQIEPETPVNEDLRPAQRRMILALVLTAPMLVAMIPGLGWHIPGWLQAVFATPVVFGAGLGFFRRAGRQALHFQSSMDTLIALGSSIAWAFAVGKWWRAGRGPKSGGRVEAAGLETSPVDR